MKDYIRTTIRGGVVLCVPPKDMEELHATISRLEANLSDAYAAICDQGHVDDLIKLNDSMAETISRLREYIQHKPECQTRPENPWPNGLPTCDCGYDALMAEVGENNNGG